MLHDSFSKGKAIEWEKIPTAETAEDYKMGPDNLVAADENGMLLFGPINFSLGEMPDGFDVNVFKGTNIISEIAFVEG
jgi:hypothetical protein